MKKSHLLNIAFPRIVVAVAGDPRVSTLLSVRLTCSLVQNHDHDAIGRGNNLSTESDSLSLADMC